MNIVDLAILKKMVAGGGGSGTDNYNDLLNLPQINGETLAGNKSAENLGLQDALTFDSTPTEDSTNPVESGGIYNALLGKQDNLTFDGVYNASTNKAATESTVTNAIAGLDVSDFSVDADETISSISETDGKISVTKQDIAIASNQVVAMTGYTKPSSAPATPAIQQGDTENEAIGKLEFKVDTNQTNILSAESMVCDNAFSTSTAYAEGDIVTYNHKLYKFKTAHSAGAWDSSHVDQISTTGLITPELIELCDSGAKNLVDTSTTTVSGFTFTQDSNGYITQSPNDSDSRSWNYANSQYKFTLTAGTYVLVLDIKTASNNNSLGADIYDSSNNNKLSIVASDIKGKTGMVTASFTIATAGSYGLMIKQYDMVARYMICTAAAWNVSHKYVPYRPNWDLVSSVAPFYSIPINHNMIYRGQNLGASLTDAQHTALSSGNFTDLYLGDYWTKSVTIPDFYELTTAQPSDWTTNYTSYYTKSGNTYTAVTGSSAPTWAADTYYTKSVPTQTVTLKAVIADFDTFYAGYASSYAGINTHHAGVIVTGFNNVVWNKTNSTAGGYVSSLIHKWLVGSVLPQLETWFGSAKVLSHQKLLTNAITGDAASGWAWSSQKISLLSECQLYGMKVWGGSKATNGAYEPGEAFKKLDVFNHIDANLLFGNINIWCRDIASAEGAARLHYNGSADTGGASFPWLAPAALILLS